MNEETQNDTNSSNGKLPRNDNQKLPRVVIPPNRPRGARAATSHGGNASVYRIGAEDEEEYPPEEK